MKSRLRLVELPFLAATLAMILALVLPWAFIGPLEDGQRVVEVGSILPWAVPEPIAQAADPGVQLAGQADATPSGVTQQ